jgi:hypothetical protein
MDASIANIKTLGGGIAAAPTSDGRGDQQSLIANH